MAKKKKNLTEITTLTITHLSRKTS